MLYDLSNVHSNLEELEKVCLPHIDFTAIWSLPSTVSRNATREYCTSALTRADESLAALRTARDKIDGLVRKVELWRAIAAHSLLPILSLPIHVLHIIFAFAAREDPSPVTRLSLSQVCRRWRGASLALRRMWSNLVISSRRDAGKVPYFATKSRPCRFTLEIKSTADFPLDEADLTSILRGQQARAMNLAIEVTLPLVYFRTTDLNKLNSFALTDSPTVTPGDTPVTFFLSSLPVTLRSLTVQSRNTVIVNRQFPPFSNLTHVRLALLALDDFDRVILSTTPPTLKSLVLDRLKEEAKEDHWVGMQDNLIHLRTLVITLVPLELIERLADHFPMPELRRLDVNVKTASPSHLTRATKAFRSIVSSRTTRHPMNPILIPEGSFW